ncbi:TRAP transporter large permease [Kushneria indalinina]|uniref:TRAP transporter large permease protein n=1 Tax=Kushneria indalinina DSM 14324 TaxID=1122140 RepID=A0A3D9DSG1_9GAMM|nr:TRAP transporter large permease [Kushneria indalinina]REC93687.1 tripartite ATP-independent transporter DctM subunit [Kushneria indalinina DSM 14324]
MTALMTVLFVVVMLLGVPIGAALLLGATGAIVALGDMPANIAIMNLFRPMQNFTLVAIPFFIMSGALMMSGVMGQKIIGLASLLVGRFRGGLGQVNVLGSALFGGVSGSAVADASAMGAVMIPWMSREGYPPALSGAITASSSIISVLIPPSIPLLIFATISNSSVADLFMAGVIPGLMLTVMMMGICYLLGYFRHFPISRFLGTPREMGLMVLSALPAIALPIMILALLRLGIATPTEVSVTAVAYALLVRVLIYRDLDLSSLLASTIGTVATTGVVMLVIAASSVVSYVLAAENIPAMISDWALTTLGEPWKIIAMMIVIMLVVGMFIDLSAAILLLGPLFVVLADAIDLSLVQLGVMMTLNLAIGLFTPPVGTTLFIAAALAKKSVGSVARELWPFYLAAALVLLLVSYVPLFTLQ